MVAADTAEVQSATDRFNGVLGLSLLGLGCLLLLTAWAQVVLGLSPLNKLHAALQAVRQGQSQRLEGQFPNELHALISDFNTVLDRNTEVVTRARTQAGNLAHALKTPLAVLRNAATQAPDHEWRPLVQGQVDMAQRQIDWHLARARTSAAHRLPGQRTEVTPVIEGLLRVMRRLHLERRLDISVSALPTTLFFAGEEQDLQEMLGNLLDNACRNAHTRVNVSVQAQAHQWVVKVDDDGPGVPPSQHAAVLQRGVRLDESQPGSGLGLSIVVELAELYDGHLTLHTSPMQGLQASLTLPTAT
jgi:signal transduction histidine kinase